MEKCESVKIFADHFSLEPLFLISESKEDYYTNYSQYIEANERMKNEYEIEDIMNLSYIEWVRKVNQDYKEPPPESGGGIPKLSIVSMIRMLIDGIRGL